MDFIRTLSTEDTNRPNLLSSLFTWHSRESITPAQNFLTEALVYVLRTDRAARTAWIREIVGADAKDETIQFSTRAAYLDETSGSTIYPDVEVTGVRGEGVQFRILSEHKWDAGLDLSQLERYARLLKDNRNAFLLFVCQSIDDHRQASRLTETTFPNVIFRSMLWESVYAVLARLPDESRILWELLDFMRDQGLSPGEPITEAMMQAYLESRPFLERLKRYANKLLHEKDWSFFPERYRTIPESKVADRYRRIAIEFETGAATAITVGFLYDTADHQVPFCDPSNKSIDVFLRIETDNPSNNPHPRIVQEALETKVSSLSQLHAKVLLHRDRENRNRNTLLIAQRSLAELIRDKHTERDQIDAIYAQLSAWGKALFDDGLLEPKLMTLPVSPG